MPGTSRESSPTPMLTAPAPRHNHIRPLLWKNFLLKKKHPVKWALEILVPVIFIVLMGALKHLMKEVKVPSGWSDTSKSVDGHTGTSYNLFQSNMYYITETTTSALLWNLAIEAYKSPLSMANLTAAQNLSCMSFVVQGKVNLDPTSPNAIPTACQERIIPRKIAIVPDNAYTRNYFGQTISKWYPAVTLTNDTLSPVIPAFNDSIIYFADEAALESHVKSNDYGRDINHPYIHSAIVFKNPPTENDFGKAQSIDYVIRLNSTTNDFNNIDGVPRTNVPAYSSQQKKINTENFEAYTKNGFMTLQTLVTRFA
ncbi:ATP-binding Cassette (ABC) Superfamily, partial [Thraustotheca clavata]